MYEWYVAMHGDAARKHWPGDEGFKKREEGSACVGAECLMSFGNTPHRPITTMLLDRNGTRQSLWPTPTSCWTPEKSPATTL
jgi:hypothetical protein